MIPIKDIFCININTINTEINSYINNKQFDI